MVYKSKGCLNLFKEHIASSIFPIVKALAFFLVHVARSRVQLAGYNVVPVDRHNPSRTSEYASVSV